MRRPFIVIVCAALIAVMPLLVFGCSCGHDFDFHIQSWLDAAEQLRHGTLMPHWIFSAAFNAGEPRFIFYPPLSWMTGALLSFVVPASQLPAVYTLLVLTAAGLAMHHLARHFVRPNAALVVAVFYVVNPYMLFTAYERTAYAELLAAAWLPLLFLAALRARPSVPGIALPVALLWLTNAPAAVMGSYTLALIITVRVVVALVKKPRFEDPFRLAVTAIFGTVLGLALPAFYLVPAAYERRFVQIAMALLPNMRFQDNFLFGHTGDGPHDTVLAQASLLALGMLLVAFMLTFASLLAPLLRKPGENTAEHDLPLATRISLALLTALIAFLLSARSTPLWNHVPELAFLQFPWRFLSVVAVVLTLSIALLLSRTLKRPAVTLVAATVVAAGLTLFGIHSFREPCDTDDLPSTRAQHFAAHTGDAPTDEYTPSQADNDALRSDDPGFWLSPDPTAFAPGTTPNPLASPPAFPPRAAVAAPSGTPLPGHAPFAYTLTAPAPEFAILNLRRYPNWHISVNGHDAAPATGAARDDGLTVVAVPVGVSTLRVDWRRTPDQQVGLLITLLAACVYGWLARQKRSRRIEA